MRDIDQEMTEFEMKIMGIGESQYYSYGCQDCNFQTKVEDIVIDAFIAGSIEKNKMPEIGCPNCNGTLVYLELWKDKILLLPPWILEKDNIP